MAVIKPVQFPHIHRPQTQNNTRPVKPNSVNPAAGNPAPRPENTPRPTAKSTASEGVVTSREEKLEIAIEVLRQKTAQFYGPKKNEVKQTAARGTFIDIKA